MTTLAPAPTGLPTRAAPRGTEPLERLFEMDTAPLGAVRGGLTDELAAAYAGDLVIPERPDRPTVVANFVETLDGLTALDRMGRTGGGEVSGFSPTDRFVMGLLRALADVVLVGASTVRSSARRAWTPDSVFPEAAAAYAALRTRLGLPARPTTLIATAGGDLDPGHPVFSDPLQQVVVAGPGPAVERLRRRPLPGHVAVELLEHDGPDGARDLVDLAGRLGAGVVLAEGGPHLFGELVRADRLDELFLTIAPQLAGRGRADDRLGLVEGAALWPEQPRWAHLRSARRAGDHLFLRYRFEHAA